MARFKYIDVAKKTRAVICMITWGMVLGALVSPIEVARGQIITKLDLQFVTT